MLVMNSHVREILRFVACTEFLRKNVHHFIPIKNKMIRCPLRRPRPLRHPPPSSPSPSFCRRDRSCRPRHRPLPSTLVTVAHPPPLLPSPSLSSPSLVFIAASIDVAAVTLPLSITRHPRRRRHCPRCRRPSPSSPLHLPLLPLLPSPSPSSSPATHVAVTIAVALALAALTLFFTLFAVARPPPSSPSPSPILPSPSSSLPSSSAARSCCSSSPVSSCSCTPSL